MRDEAIATKLGKETWGQVQMKELEEYDLKKTLSEVTQRQKEFCSAYEVVKNERNKYLNIWISQGKEKRTTRRSKNGVPLVDRRLSF